MYARNGLLVSSSNMFVDTARYYFKVSTYFSHPYSVEAEECLTWHSELTLAVLFIAGTCLVASSCYLNVGLLMVVSPLTDRTE